MSFSLAVISNATQHSGFVWRLDADQLAAQRISQATQEAAELLGAGLEAERGLQALRRYLLVSKDIGAWKGCLEHAWCNAT